MSKIIGMVYRVEQKQDGEWVAIPIKAGGETPVYGTPKGGLAHKLLRRLDPPCRIVKTVVSIEKQVLA